MTAADKMPLPEPESTVCIQYTERGITTSMWRTPGRSYYTADQMHAYARQYAAARAAPLVEALSLAIANNAGGLLMNKDEIARCIAALASFKEKP